MTRNELQTALTMPQFPLSAKYDAELICENQMGPCALWLCEFLMGKMDLKPGMRVLDMGCGKGITSIFLAKEYGVTVVANDLWIKLVTLNKSGSSRMAAGSPMVAILLPKQTPQALTLLFSQAASYRSPPMLKGLPLPFLLWERT
jgi:SAM-dependent methyltransferase